MAATTTLPEIPEFDRNGLWKYQSVLFSAYGNLKQIIIELIRRSETGLRACKITIWPFTDEWERLSNSIHHEIGFC